MTFEKRSLFMCLEIRTKDQFQQESEKTLTGDHLRASKDDKGDENGGKKELRPSWKPV